MDILIIIVLLIITLGSYIYIEIIYRKYKKIKLKNLKSGFEISREIIDNYELNNIYITESKNVLFSYYDYDRKVIRLANGVFNDTSLVSCAIAATCASYAVYDKQKDKLFSFRKTFEKLATTILYLGYIVITIGILFGNIMTILTGVALEYAVLLFYLFTYKLEKSIKIRALHELKNNKLITKNEIKKIEELLKANSYIYIASIVFPISRLFKLIIDFGKSDRN